MADVFRISRWEFFDKNWLSRMNYRITPKQKQALKEHYAVFLRIAIKAGEEIYEIAFQEENPMVGTGRRIQSERYPGEMWRTCFRPDGDTFTISVTPYAHRNLFGKGS